MLRGFPQRYFSLALDEFVTDNGVKTSVDTLAVYPVMENNRCIGVVCESVSGKEFFGCKAIIDATGTAVIADRAGLPTIVGKNYMSYLTHMYQTEMSLELSQTRDVCKFRNGLAWAAICLETGTLRGCGCCEEIPQRMSLTMCYMVSIRCLSIVRSLIKNGYDIMMLPAMPQFRTIRRILGETELTAEDGRQYSDSIGVCGDFRPDGAGKHYEIPYRSLYHTDFPNILACGRIISAPQGDGWEIARVIPTCALTGEAAGNAATLTVKNKCAASEVNIAELQKLQQSNKIKISLN